MNGTLGNNQVQDYASYRYSSAGGNHKVKIVEVENIYNEFNQYENRNGFKAINSNEIAGYLKNETVNSRLSEIYLLN